MSGVETSMRKVRNAEKLRSVRARRATLQDEVERLIALYQRGALAEVVAQSEALASRHPREAMLYNILGAASIGLEQFARAEAAFVKAAALDPGDAEIRNNHGIALSGQGKLDQAVAAFTRALVIRPDYAEAHYNLGNALRKQQAVAPAIAAYSQALAIRPDYAEAHNNLGMAYQQQRQPEAALAAYGRALAIKPKSADTLYNLGSLLTELKNFPGAIDAYRLTLAIDPNRPGAHAQRLFAQANICDFAVYDDYAALKAAGSLDSEAVTPFTMLVFEDDPERQLAYSRAWSAQAAVLAPPPLSLPAKAAGERIRIGYFSADFHDHATLCLMSGLFREHDRDRFEVIVYSYGPPCDGPLRAQLVQDVDRFIDVRELPDPAIVELARADALDIAVDLKGYTQHSRAQIFVQRLAPIQIAYLGYPGSMGAGFMDYLIADNTVIPPAEQRFYSERIVRLPGSYQPNDERRAIADTTTTRASFGLPRDGFVFCCFNQNYKISPREFAIWMRLLDAVQGSVLWLLRSNQWAEANLRREAEACGIDPARLVFADTLPQAEHLARLRHADLFLDTFNVNAHTTASDALWAGLLVLTKAGRQFAARVGASLVSAVGLPELVVDSEADYEARALELATTPARLAGLRERLAANRLTQPLFDTVGYARKLEAGFAAVYERRLAGLPDDHITV